MTKDEAAMLVSLTSAINKVGGSPKMVLNHMDTMTINELITVLAPNGVRFCVEQRS